MVPAILILTFAWTLKSMTDSLGAKEYVADLVRNVSGMWLNLLPAIVFIIGVFLALLREHHGEHSEYLSR